MQAYITRHTMNLIHRKICGGTRTIELRLESFNLTNHFNWGNPATNLSF